VTTKEYGWRKIKFHDPGLYQQFMDLTHDRGSDVTSECNLMVRMAVKTNKLLSESAVILEEVK